MAELKDIKDRSPNKATISALEDLLDQAKKGELRSFLYVASFDNQQTTSGWSIDSRCFQTVMLGELELLKHDFTCNLLINQSGSALKSIVDGD